MNFQKIKQYEHELWDIRQIPHDSISEETRHRKGMLIERLTQLYRAVSIFISLANLEIAED